MDFSRSAVSRYLQLASLFRRRIEAGEWQIGQQIPTIDVLAAQCGVARATIRQALYQLEKDRLIERFRAKGTFVRASPTSNLWCDVGTDWSGMLLAREGATIELLGTEFIDELPGPLDDFGKPAPSYLKLRRRHWREKTPFLLASVFIEKKLSKRVPKTAWTIKTAMRLIHDVPDLKIADGRQTLTIGSADPEIATDLELPLNAPVAFVRRIALDADGTILLLANGIYRGDVVRVDIKLK